MNGFARMIEQFTRKRYDMEHSLTPLCELALKHGTDKGGWHLKAGDTCHNYTPAYHELFKYRREQVKRVLEIGVNYGPSLRMWRDYFPNATVFGFDCNEACLFQEDRIECYAADQNNKASLLHAIQQTMYTNADTDQYDLIVDDGSHEFAHQLFSPHVLLPYLAPLGAYVIEDITYDCDPAPIGDGALHFAAMNGVRGFKWEAMPTGIGIGKAHCWEACPKCHGATGEQLVVITRE